MAVQWDTSWTNSRHKTVEGALERIARMLTRSYLSVQAVQRDQQAKDTYVQYFKDPTLTYLDHVTNVVQLMHDRVTTATQVITMSYVPDMATFGALGLGPLPAGATIDDVYAFVQQVGISASTPLTIYIAPNFFKDDVYVSTDPNKGTGTGTILHELSHGVGGTDDYAYTPDANYANLLATKLTRNADTYRAYCQSFDTP